MRPKTLASILSGMGQRRAGEEREGRKAGRLDACGTTVWANLKGARGFAYLHEHYGEAIRGVIEARIQRGDFKPLSVNNDADECYPEFLNAIHREDWLATYPDEQKGRFRPYLYERIRMFLRDKRRQVAGDRHRRALPLDNDGVEEPATHDPVYAEFDRRCLASEVHACLWEIGLMTPLHERILRLAMEEPRLDRRERCKRLGIDSLDKFKRRLADAFEAFRHAWHVRGGAPGEIPDFGASGSDA